MKAKVWGLSRRFLLLAVLLVATQNGRSSTNFYLNLQGSAGKLVLSWPSTVEAPGTGVMYPEYTVERSTDLRTWQPVGGELRGLRGGSGPMLNLSVDSTPGAGFFRVNAQLYSPAPQATGDGGSQVFGYDTRFADELSWTGFLPVEGFVTDFPQPSCLSQINFDPRAAQFWAGFNTNAAFGLNAAELAVFLTNGFVVSERLGQDPSGMTSPSFGGIYYRVFHNDLPVFVTSDSILEAWHRTYLNMLEELEELELATLQDQILSNMTAQLLPAWNRFGHGPLSNSIIDADYFLTVARSLWFGQQMPSQLPVAGQGQAVTTTLTAISNLTLVEDFPIFGSVRSGVDFSQFTVRGHYNNWYRLQRYFQTLMWCGFINLRLVTYPPNQEDDLRELGTVVVLDYLLNRSGQFTNWSAFDQVSRAFVGRTDSMTFAQLDQLLAAANIHSPADLPDYTALTNLQTRLIAGHLGLQSITSDVLFSPWGPAQLELPRSFTVFGQKFILDSWAFQQVVFDKVLWPSTNTMAYCGMTNLFGKVIRRKPTCLDVAFSVFGNDQTVPDIVARITSTNGEPFRDGLPYQHNLTAARNVINTQNDAAWSDNFYTAWLAALRALSAPHHRRAVSRGDAHPCLGDEDAQHATRLVDRVAPRHGPLRETIVHAVVPLQLPVRLCRAASGILAEHAGTGGLGRLGHLEPAALRLGHRYDPIQYLSIPSTDNVRPLHGQIQPSRGAREFLRPGGDVAGDLRKGTGATALERRGNELPEEHNRVFWHLRPGIVRVVSRVVLPERLLAWTWS